MDEFTYFEFKQPLMKLNQISISVWNRNRISESSKNGKNVELYGKLMRTSRTFDFLWPRLRPVAYRVNRRNVPKDVMKLVRKLKHRRRQRIKRTRFRQCWLYANIKKSDVPAKKFRTKPHPHYSPYAYGHTHEYLYRPQNGNEHKITAYNIPHKIYNNREMESSWTTGHYDNKLTNRIYKE